MNECLGFETHLIILGEKLNNFIPAKSQIELNKYINMAKTWIKNNPDKSYNFYEA